MPDLTSVAFSVIFLSACLLAGAHLLLKRRKKIRIHTSDILLIRYLNQIYKGPCKPFMLYVPLKSQRFQFLISRSYSFNSQERCQLQLWSYPRAFLTTTLSELRKRESMHISLPIKIGNLTSPLPSKPLHQLHSKLDNILIN